MAKGACIGTPAFTQPILGSNGTLGGSAFAVHANNVYSAEYDSFNVFTLDASKVYSSGANPSSGTVYFTIYNPIALKISKIAFTNVPSGLTSSSPKEIEIQGSNNNSSWTTLKNYTNTDNTNGSSWSVDISGGYYKYYRIAIKSANTTQAYVNIGKIAITATTEYSTATEVAKGYIGIDGVARKIKKAYIGDENGIARDCWGGLEIVSWATGTDEQIVAMVEAADRGEINLADYWTVGDTRTVSLSAITSSDVMKNIEAQNIELVLMHAGGYELTQATESGRNTCSFIVGMKDCVKTTGAMNAGTVTTGGWSAMARRTWCNDIFYNSLPKSLRGIFKQANVFYSYTNGGVSTCQDYFTFPTEVEITGTRSYAVPAETSKSTHLTWYKTTANRKKKANGTTVNWWERSLYQGGDQFCYINTSGISRTEAPNKNYGLSPHGFI